MIRKLDHLVITTENLPACVAFYEALGFTPRHGGGRWELFCGDFKLNVHIKGHELQPNAKRAVPGSADLCFETDLPLRACLEVLSEKGLAVELGIVPRQGALGNMHSFYLRDPDGNLIELCSYE